MRELCWKEYREHRGIWLMMAAMTALLGIGLAMIASSPGLDLMQLNRDVLMSVASMMVVAYGLVCGSMMLAGENEAKTLVFLDTHSGLRAPLWTTKALAGTVFTLTQALLLIGLIVPFCLANTEARLPQLWLLAVLALDAYAWGLMASALARTGFGAAILGAVFMALSWIVTGLAMWVLPQSWLAVRLAMAAGAVALSYRIFCEPDRRRMPIVRGQPRVTNGWAPARRVLLWLTWRQARVEAGIVLVTAVLLGFLVPRIDLVLAFGVILLAGVVCGVAAFADEQEGGSFRFVCDQRLPVGSVWRVKTLSWFLIALIAASAIVLGVAVYYQAMKLPGRSPAELNGLDEHIRLLGMAPLLYLLRILGMVLVYGFAAGHLAGLIARRRVPALVVAGALALVLVALWLPSLVFGGLPLWQLLVPPLLLLATGRLVMWWWASDRLLAARPLAYLMGCGGFVGLWMAGGLWYRVAQVPDADAPFNRKAFEAQLAKAAQSTARELIQTGTRELREQMERASAKLAPPALPAGARENADRAPGGGMPWAAGTAESSYEHLLDKAIAGGWPKEPGKLDEWLNELFAGAWVESFRNASTAPLGLIQDLRQMTVENYFTLVDQTRPVFPVLAGRALQLQACGKDADALELLVTALGLTRQLRHDTSLMGALIAQGMEYTVLGAFDHWLVKVGPRPKLLRRALQELTHHENSLPRLSENIKAEYLVAQNTLETLFRPNAGMGPQLYALARHVPWEKEREERLLNLFFSFQLKQATLPYWEIEPRRIAVATDHEQSSARAAQRELEQALRQMPGGYAFRESIWWHILVPTLYYQVNRQKATELCWLRGERLRLALALYQIDNGKPATRLTDLLPRYLDKLPLDPFSGAPFLYRVSQGERITSWSDSPEAVEQRLDVAPGQGVLWSVGPDRNDDGGLRQGGFYRVRDPQIWANYGLDMIFLVPQWPKQ